MTLSLPLSQAELLIVVFVQESISSKTTSEKSSEKGVKRTPRGRPKKGQKKKTIVDSESEPDEDEDEEQSSSASSSEDDFKPAKSRAPARKTEPKRTPASNKKGIYHFRGLSRAQ